MADHIVNALTGEVTLEIDGETFKLRASMGRLSDLMAVLDKPGLTMLQFMMIQMDPRALYHGMRCLCTSGNEAKLRDMLLLPHLEPITGALTAALAAGLPEVKESAEGNGLEAGATVN